jgi:hypothetical protein
MHIREGLLGSVRINLLCGLMFYPEHGVIDLSDTSNIAAEFYHNVRYHTTEDVIVIVTLMRTLNLTFTVLIIRTFNEATGQCFL